MQTAINFSPAAQSLLGQGVIDFDRWKSAPRKEGREQANAVPPTRPLYVHFPLDLGEPDFARTTDWDAIERLREETDTPFVNVHLNARRDHFPNTDSLTHERAMVQERFLRHLDLVTHRFGAERVIAENVIYRGEAGPFLRASVEPDLITNVIAQTGCGLLLDTAHARITCTSLAMAVTDYLDALPCHCLRELHVTGTQHEGNRLRDSMPLSDEDWQTAAWVLEQIKTARWPTPWLVALEYGGIGPSYEWRSDPDVIAEQLPSLQALVREV